MSIFGHGHGDGYGHGPGVGPGKALEDERSKLSFPTMAMTALIYGGVESANRRRYLHSLIDQDDTFRKWDNHFLSRQQMYKRGLEKTHQYITLQKEFGITDDRELFYLRVQIDENLPISLHHSMFIPTIRGQGTEEQQLKWLPLALSYSIIGTYVQTELAHGSNVRGLETTATFERQTDEFELQTPTLTATKWWPGNLGKTATHIILMARLIVGDHDYGIHAFIVQLRDLTTHQPLKGVTVGDIGPKFAYEMMDNGFLRLDGVRIPRSQMLARFATLDRDGKYTHAIHAKLSYSTMVFVRSWIVIEASRYLARAVTIATRYSIVRKQFPRIGVDVGNKSDSKKVASSSKSSSRLVEESVLNYQTQQAQLLPLIATSYAFHFTGIYMERLYDESTNNLKRNDLSLLKEVHINSSGLKALTTSVTSEGIEICRKCCGGHGYSKFSGLVDLLGNYIPANTYEGENTLMFLQCARNLLKTYIDASTGKNQSTGLISYYNDISILEEKCSVQKLEDWLSPVHQMKCFIHRSLLLMNTTANRFIENLQNGSSFEHAFEVCKVDLVRCAKAHCWHVIFHNFLMAINQSPEINNTSNYNNNSIPIELQPVLRSLCSLFALTQIVDGLADTNEDWYLTSAQIAMLREQVRRLLLKIRKDSVGLVDAFDFSDVYLNSALGKWDGNVYECLYKWAQTGNPMNDSRDDTLVSARNDILLPILANGKAKLESHHSKL